MATLSHRGRRVRRWVLAGLIAALATCLAGPPVRAQEKDDQPAILGWLESKLISYLQGMTGYRIGVGRSIGTVLGALVYQRVTLSDHRGVFARIRQIEFDWSARRLLAGEIQVNKLIARDVQVLRLPEKRVVERKPGDAPPKIPSRPVQLPFVNTTIDLPFSLNIKQFALRNVSLAPAVAGAAARLSVDGRAYVEDDGSVLGIELRLERHAGAAPSGHIRIALPRKPRNLTVDVLLEDRPGGLLTRALGLKANESVRFELKGDDPIDRWRGTLKARAGELAKVDAKITADAVDSGHRVRLTASGASSLLSGRLAVFGNPVELDYDAIYSRGAVQIRRLAIKGAPGELVITGRAPTDGKSIDLRLEATASDLAKFQPLTGLPLAGAGKVSAWIQGRTAAPALTLSASVSEMQVDRLRARNAELNLAFIPRDNATAPWQGDLHLRLTSDDAAVADGRGGFRSLAALNMSLAGAVDWPARRIELKDLTAVLGDARLKAAGTVERISPLKFSGRLAFRGNLPDGLLGPVRVNRADVDGRVALDAGARTGSARLRARVAVLRTGTAAVDALLDGPVDMALDLGWKGDEVDVAALSLRARLMTLDGKGKLASRPGARFEARATVPDLAPLSRILGQRLKGVANLSLTIAGAGRGYDADVTATGEAIQVGRLRLGDVRAGLTASNLSPTSGSATLTIAARGAWPTALIARVRHAGGGRWRLGIPRGRIGGARLTANGTLNRDTGTFDGQLRLAAGSLGRLLRPFGIPASGALFLAARLRSRGRVQSGYIRANGRRLRFGSTRVGQIRVRLSAGNLREMAGLTGTVAASNLNAGGVALRRATGRFRATRRGTRFTVTAQPVLQNHPAQVSAQGLMRRGGGWTRIDLAALGIRYQRLRARLTRPAQLRFGPGVLEIRRTQIAIAGGQIDIDYAQRSGRVSGAVAARRLPARLLALAGVGNPAHGQIDGAVTFAGTSWRPVTRFDLRATGVRRAFSPANAALTLAAKGQLTANRVEAAGTVGTAASNRRLRFTLRSRTGGGGQTEARLTGQIDLAPVSNSGLFWAHRLSGVLNANLTIASGRGGPQASGEIRLSNGRFEHAATGAVLRDLTVVARGAGRRIALVSVKGNDGSGGTISATGGLTLDADAGYPFDIGLEARRVAVARREDLDLTVSGKLRVSKAAGAGMSLRGDITVDKGELLIPKGGAPSIPRLKVVEVGTPRGSRNRRAARPRGPGGVAPPMQLSLNVNVPRRLFIRGRGLEVELGGRLRVSGTTANPRAEGRLRTVRGRMDLLSKRFEITRGQIRLNNPSLANPTLDFAAEATGGGITATILVTGTARQPKFRFESSPALPEDQILARVIFGKDVADMTGSEALQLAASVATLVGAGGGGVLNKLRRAAGLDVVDVTTDASGRPRAVAGKYVTDRVLVKVEQGLKPGSSAAGVEVEVRRNFKVEAKTGSDGRQRIGLKWRYDY